MEKARPTRREKQHLSAIGGNPELKHTNQLSEQIMLQYFQRTGEIHIQKKSQEVRQQGGTHYLSDHWGLSALSLRLSSAAWSMLQSRALHNNSRRGGHR